MCEPVPKQEESQRGRRWFLGIVSCICNHIIICLSFRARLDGGRKEESRKELAENILILG